jgi:hypothetical protein
MGRGRDKDAQIYGAKASGPGREGVCFAMGELTDLRLLALKV